MAGVGREAEPSVNPLGAGFWGGLEPYGNHMGKFLGVAAIYPPAWEVLRYFANITTISAVAPRS